MTRDQQQTVINEDLINELTAHVASIDDLLESYDLARWELEGSTDAVLCQALQDLLQDIEQTRVRRDYWAWVLEHAQAEVAK